MNFVLKMIDFVLKMMNFSFKRMISMQMDRRRLAPDLSGAMCSYNALNGVPACADKRVMCAFIAFLLLFKIDFLLIFDTIDEIRMTLMRETWNFTGSESNAPPPAPVSHSQNSDVLADCPARWHTAKFIICNTNSSFLIHNSSFLCDFDTKFLVLNTKFIIFAPGIVSDDGAVSQIWRGGNGGKGGTIHGHFYANSTAAAAADALNGGCDVTYGGGFSVGVPASPGVQPGTQAAEAAVESGLMSQATLTAAVRRSLATRMRTGELDVPSRSPWDTSKLNLGVVDCAAHRALALNAALSSAVLLENAAGALALPIVSKQGGVVAVLGAGANWTHGMVSTQASSPLSVSSGGDFSDRLLVVTGQPIHRDDQERSEPAGRHQQPCCKGWHDGQVQ